MGIEGKRDSAPSCARAKLDHRPTIPSEGEQLGQLDGADSRGQAEAISDPMRVTIRTPKEASDRPWKHPQ
jgi:hypothetical protein